MLFHGYIMVGTWFSDGQPSYNNMVDIDTDMVNHVSTLFTTADSKSKKLLILSHRCWHHEGASEG